MRALERNTEGVAEQRQLNRWALPEQERLPPLGVWEDDAAGANRWMKRNRMATVAPRTCNGNEAK